MKDENQYVLCLDSKVLVTWKLLDFPNFPDTLLQIRNKHLNSSPGAQATRLAVLPWTAVPSRKPALLMNFSIL